jgi:branched-chain amino acid transport system ATP-binding protein
VIRDLYARLPQIVAEGVSLIVVEQDIVQALNAAKDVYCLQEGRVALAGRSASVSHAAISAAYFGA